MVGLDERLQGPTLPQRRRAVLPGLWSWQPGHCGGTRGEGGGATTELRVAKLAQVSAKAGAKGLRARGGGAGPSAQARAEASSAGHTPSRHSRVSEVAARHLSVSALKGAHHPLPWAPHWPRSLLTHPGAGPRRVPKLREAPGVLGNEENGH